MSLRTKRIDGMLVLEVDGSLSQREARVLGLSLIKARGAGDRRVVVDFSQLSKIDTEGFGEFLSAHTAVANRGTVLAWAGSLPWLQDWLRSIYIGPSPHLRFFDSVTEAIAELRQLDVDDP